jgi:hypothetical protein
LSVCFNSLAIYLNGCTESDDTRCCDNTICPPEDGHDVARNMSKTVKKNIKKRLEIINGLKIGGGGGLCYLKYDVLMFCFRGLSVHLKYKTVTFPIRPVGHLWSIVKGALHLFVI